jgi:hypothetical protein
MFVPLLAVPLAMQLIADGVPKLDVTPSCRGAAQAGYMTGGQDRLQRCIESEQRTRDKLSQEWASFAVGDRTYCVQSIKGFQPTYSELATCLEMRRDIKTIRTPEATHPPRPARPPVTARAIASGDGVPTLDVTGSCQGAAAAGYVAQGQDRLQACLNGEQRTRDKLAQDWSTFPAADRNFCIVSIWNFQPTYTELATCLEMKRDVRRVEAPAPARTPALPVALPVSGVPADVPRLDVRPSCRGAAKAGYFSDEADRLQICVNSEHRTLEKIGRDWPTFAAEDRAYCTASVRGFNPTYTELATCLEMRRDVKILRANPADPVKSR